MSVTRSQVETLIQSKISGNAGLITPADHEDVLFDETNSLLNALYSLTTTTDTHSTTTVFTANSSSKQYSFNIKKDGSVVFVNGYIYNNTGNVLPADTDWFSITTTAFQQNAKPYYINGDSTEGDRVKCILTGNVFGSLSAIGIGETVYFDFNYNTNA